MDMSMLSLRSSGASWSLNSAGGKSTVFNSPIAGFNCGSAGLGGLGWVYTVPAVIALVSRVAVEPSGGRKSVAVVAAAAVSEAMLACWLCQWKRRPRCGSGCPRARCRSLVRPCWTPGRRAEDVGRVNVKRRRPPSSQSQCLRQPSKIEGRVRIEPKLHSRSCSSGRNASCWQAKASRPDPSSLPIASLWCVFWLQ